MRLFRFIGFSFLSIFSFGVVDLIFVFVIIFAYDFIGWDLSDGQTMAVVIVSNFVLHRAVVHGWEYSG